MPDLTPEAVREIRRLLEEARREIAATVASSDWAVRRQSMLLAEIDHQLAQFDEQARRALKRPLDAQFGEGQAVVDGALAGRGVSVALFPQIAASNLAAAAQSDLAGKITHLTRDAKAEIARALNVGLLGGKTPFETMTEIGKSLDGGRFKLVAARAELIVKEEFGRVYRKGAQLRQEQAAARVAGLKKRWLHAGHPRVPRPTHLALHGVVIGVTERFDLVNMKTGEVEHPLHPKDRVLSAENSIACGCVAQPWKESWNLTLPELPAVA
jgi:hypothetical protein